MAGLMGAGQYKIRTYTATVTVVVYEDMESSWHEPFTEAQAKRLALDLLPGKGSTIEAGGYGSHIQRETLRKVSESRSPKRPPSPSRY
jgi:hypothetical protein